MQFTLYLKELKEIFGVWWQGFLDALQFPSVYRVLKRDSLLRTLVYQCFLLNGVIFVGSNLLFTKGIQPLTNYFFKFDETLDPSLQSLIWLFQQFYWIAHLILWQFPVYGISFILNGIWYDDISLRVYHYHYPPKRSNESGSASTSTSRAVTNELQTSARIPLQNNTNSHNSSEPRRFRWDRFVASLADQLYKLCLVLAYILVSIIWYYVPYIGLPMNFVMCCWLYSLYCFDYKWTISYPNVTFEQRRFCLETCWIYFFGFGTPFNVACFFFPYLISYGVYAFLFPVFLIMAARAKPTQPSSHHLHFFPQRVLVFQQADWVLNFSINLIHSLPCLRSTKKNKI